jgi:hypothetical protein
MTFFDAQVAGLEPSLLINKLNLSPKTLGLLFQKIRVLENGCWEWMAAKTKGYGCVKIRAIRKTSFLQVHRLCYELVNGPIESGLQLHHKVEEGCIGPSCCNPSHLKAVTPREHLCELSPNSLPYKQLHRSSECHNGHPYTIETVVFRKGVRCCRACERDKTQRQRDAARGTDGPGRSGPQYCKLYCKRGHLVIGANVRWVSSPSGDQRQCRACHNERRKGYAKAQKMGQLNGVNGATTVLSNSPEEKAVL